jgi:hypothetical protein
MLLADERGRRFRGERVLYSRTMKFKRKLSSLRERPEAEKNETEGAAHDAWLREEREEHAARGTSSPLAVSLLVLLFRLNAFCIALGSYRASARLQSCASTSRQR